MLITFSGIDGAGKTTLAAWTARYLEQNDHDVFAAARKELAITDWLGSLGANINSGDGESPHPLLGRLGMMGDEVATALMARIPAKLTGADLVLDRCGYDGLVHMSYRGSLSESRLLDASKRIYKRDYGQHIAFHLTVDSELARERCKENHALEYYDEKTRLYEQVFSNVPHVIVETRTLSGAIQAIRTALETVGTG